MSDTDLARSIAAAARASLAAMERGEWPDFPEDIDPPDPRLLEPERLESRWANAVCEFLHGYFFDAAHGGPTYAGIPFREAPQRVMALLEQLEQGRPIEDPEILAHADRRRWPRIHHQRQPFGDRE